MKYEPTIGLEIHAELKTQTKMFCNSKNDPDEKRPNVNICPVCMGHPGTLPVINKEAVKHVLKVGIAVHGKIADYTRFDRKNYFYPDLPKGYQISQYEFPLVSGGEISGVVLERIHLEEDTGRSSHDVGNYSLVDFNRAGIPLMELVTKPVIKTAEQASNFSKELQLLLRYLGASDANMEKGEMRVEANVSISKKSIRQLADKSQKLGTKVEVKNLNSFKVVEKAIAYEIKRQSELLEKGERVVQETRGWDENKEKTFSQRTKEESHDYRYFPDPDLPPLSISKIPEFNIEKLKKEIPETPRERRVRYKKQYGVKEEDIKIFIINRELGKFFEETAVLLNDKEKIRLASNYIISDIVGLMNADNEMTTTNLKQFTIIPKSFAELVKMIADDEISSRAAKDVLSIMVSNGGMPREIAKEKNLLQKSNEKELLKIIQEIIKQNPVVVADYKNGKGTALQFLIGQAMKVTKGSANPKVLNQLLQDSLK